MSEIQSEARHHRRVEESSISAVPVPEGFARWLLTNGLDDLVTEAPVETAIRRVKNG